jgi:hypothetical protein
VTRVTRRSAQLHTRLVETRIAPGNEFKRRDRCKCSANRKYAISLQWRFRTSVGSVLALSPASRELNGGSRMKPPALVEFVLRFRERERENAQLDSQLRNNQPERVRVAARESARERIALAALPSRRSTVEAIAS